MKIKKLLVKNTIWIILVIATALRLWNLGGNPPHLTPDETALGYNAYSILKTGRDEYGELLPLIFKSFGDYKPGLYIYTAVPSIAVFGLTEFATRLPSALAGILAVRLLYKVVGELLKKETADKRRFIAIFSSLLLALNPWHIHFSRGAWEINLALTLTLAGIYFFLRAREDLKNIVYSAVFLAATLLTYQGAKLSSLIVLLTLIVTYRKEVLIWVKKDGRKVATAALLGLVVSLPIIFSLFQGKTGRLNVFSVFSYPRPEKYLQDFLDQGNENVGTPGYYLFHSEALNFTRGIIGRWSNHYSARFLFFEGDWQNPRHSVPHQGLMLLADVIALAIGFIALLRTKGRAKTFLLLWLFLVPLSSALSRDQVHAVRSFNMVIPLVVIAGFGLFRLKKYLESGKLAKLAGSSALAIAYLGSLAYFLDAQFVHLPTADAKYWEYGYKQMVEAIDPIKNDYKEIKIQQSFSQPYIYFLFYGGGKGYDPAEYQKQANLREVLAGDVGQVERLDNICFCPIDWTVNRGDTGTLFAADEIRIPPLDSQDPEAFELVSEIYYPSGDLAFRILAVK